MLIAAHRGSSGSAPENTLAAFRQAINEGADMIELDIRMTKDFELVVLHDRTVRRTTNGRGSVSRMTLSEILLFDAGSWFGKEFADQRIPTLRQVIDMLPASMLLNIEVKTDGDLRKKIAFEELLVLLIREKRIQDRVLVSSFNHRFLQRFQKLDPYIAVGALWSPAHSMTGKPASIARKTGASFLIYSIQRLSKRFVAAARANNLKIACYTVNTKKQFEKAVRLGADVIITNYPLEMRKLLLRSSSYGANRSMIHLP